MPLEKGLYKCEMKNNCTVLNWNEGKTFGVIQHLPLYRMLYHHAHTHTHISCNTYIYSPFLPLFSWVQFEYLEQYAL